MVAVVCEVPQDLSLELLREKLSAPHLSSFSTNKIGTGQVGSVFRVSLKYNFTEGNSFCPPSIVLKLASTNPESRRSGLSLGLYEREVRFYSDISPQLRRIATHALPECYHSAFDPTSGAFTILLSDAGDQATVGDDIDGANIEQARLAMAELGRIHAPFLRRSAEEQELQEAAREWLQRSSPLSGALFSQLFEGFKLRYETLVSSEYMHVCARLVESFDQYGAKVKELCTQGLIHGDFRLDNMLFNSQALEEGRPRATTELSVIIVDWQTVTWGAFAGDVAYFLGCSLRIEDRRAWTDELLQSYCDAVGEQDGDPLMSLEKFQDDLRWQSFFGVTMGIASSMLAEQTERGDNMFMTMLARHCQMVLDLNALDVLPCPSSQGSLSPNPEDEGLHPPGSEFNWNESWYFDFIDETQAIAGWVRLGILPNQKSNWYTAAVTRQGRSTLMVIDFDAPQVTPDLTLKTQDFVATHQAKSPLQTYRITLDGQARSYPSHCGALGAADNPQTTRLRLDLSFATKGKPYQYRITTRYEIPCAVDGTVTVDNQRFSLKKVPGQRDHSHGSRDWHAMDWVWSSFHTTDGLSHFHGLDLRLPSMPQMSIGYASHADTITELDSVRCNEVMQPNGSAREMTMSIVTSSGHQIAMDVKPVGHAGLKLISDDGKVCLFERAYCKVRFEDGRTAVGWFEWNRNVHELENI